MNIEIRKTDRLFENSPGAGDPACLCSRCGKAIAEGVVPIRAWPDPEHEYRFHPECLGFHVAHDQGPDYEDLDEAGDQW